MDTDGAGAPAPQDLRNVQVDNAIRAIQQKGPVPEIDFSIHRMEDGTEVNTMERVCKGTFAACTPLATWLLLHPRLLRTRDVLITGP